MAPMDERLRQLIAQGREHYDAGEYDRAEQILAKIAQEGGNFADVHNMLGVIWHAQGRFAEAEESFERALSINPAYTEAALNLSVTYNDRGKYHKAREVYGSVLQRSGDEPQKLDPYARGKLANMHAALGDAYAGLRMYAEAVRELTCALELSPTFIDLRTRLGNVYRDMGDAEAALHCYEAVKAQKPDFLPARMALGLVLYGLGRRDEAIAEWEAVLAAHPDDRRARAYLRMVREDANKVPKADER
jgi:tetratricopeptide (TPR) repeat protein